MQVSTWVTHDVLMAWHQFHVPFSRYGVSIGPLFMVQCSGLIGMNHHDCHNPHQQLFQRKRKSSVALNINCNMCKDWLCFVRFLITIILPPWYAQAFHAEHVNILKALHAWCIERIALTHNAELCDKTLAACFVRYRKTHKKGLVCQWFTVWDWSTWFITTVMKPIGAYALASTTGNTRNVYLISRKTDNQTNLTGTMRCIMLGAYDMCWH